MLSQNTQNTREEHHNSVKEENCDSVEQDESSCDVQTDLLEEVKDIAAHCQMQKATSNELKEIFKEIEEGTNQLKALLVSR